MSFRRVFAVTALAVVSIATSSSYSDAQDKGDAQQPRRLSNDERREYIALNELVDGVMAGKQPAPADLTLTFQNHFLKSADNVYVPYIVEIGGGKFTSFPVAMYVRAVAKPAADAAPAAATKPGIEVDWPFADAYFLEEKSIATVGDATQVARALALPSGEYTLYVAMRERGRDRTQQPKTAVVSRPLSVPDMNSGLTTSTIILAESLEAAPGQLTAQQQLEQPFTISGYRMTPLFTSTLPQTGELLFVFFIYNEGVAAGGKPDLELDYHFFRAGEDQPFTRLATQAFNATTLPGEFDLAGGHEVFVGQGIPLKSEQMTFAPGEYRLEIKITDKTNSQTITRNVPFTVVGA